MFIARHCGQPLIGGIVLPVITGEHLLELSGIKKLYSLLPTALCQIGEVEQILDASQTGIDHLGHNRYREGKIILPVVGYHMEASPDFLTYFHSTGIKPVQDLVLTAAEYFGNTFHTKIGGNYMSLRHLPLRAVYQKKSLTDRIGME